MVWRWIAWLHPGSRRARDRSPHVRVRYLPSHKKAWLCHCVLIFVVRYHPEIPVSRCLIVPMWRSTLLALVCAQPLPHSPPIPLTPRPLSHLPSPLPCPPAHSARLLRPLASPRPGHPRCPPPWPLLPHATPRPRARSAAQRRANPHLLWVAAQRFVAALQRPARVLSPARCVAHLATHGASEGRDL